MVSNESAIRAAGASGAASIILLIPVYFTGISGGYSVIRSHHAPLSDNSVAILLHFATALIFVAGLSAALRAAAGPTVVVMSATFGGLSFTTMMAAGHAAQMAYLETIHNEAQRATAQQVAPLILGLAEWMYRFGMIGAALLITGTSLVIYSNPILPRWWAGGAVFAVAPLFFSWAPLTAVIVILAWILVTSLLLLSAVDCQSPDAVGPLLSCRHPHIRH
ncbi:hypothetical protein [Mycobacteroides abscessus]|uniref:hypothetical protein n=1 Tax=Mycobacteroides abscessus TaxID=36809 RepID=UPI000386961F|nr:hypothetical protein [Mycobacteroides abscessus]EPZ18393.1 hypothetical protein M879_21475 [Mycobacteroides abscessus V06705]MBN7548412.1 hypothetical protein [Mycobacteroides abscessus subsp. abscessus]MDM2692264.1 hypothetical protein [Mycobacteroides abscessus]MDM2697076.1 hypothetical protein [Mycobacteroides abscessus]MDM2702200.1 hypothetical protein [Mycobacteroides abscessus]